MTNAWNETYLAIILSRYKLKDIYTADEFGLFYLELPKMTLNMKGKKCSGGKHSKVRLNEMTATIAAGEKLPIFVNRRNQDALKTSKAFPVVIGRK